MIIIFKGSFLLVYLITLYIHSLVLIFLFLRLPCWKKIVYEETTLIFINKKYFLIQKQARTKNSTSQHNRTLLFDNILVKHNISREDIRENCHGTIIGLHTSLPVRSSLVHCTAGWDYNNKMNSTQPKMGTGTILGK